MGVGGWRAKLKRLDWVSALMALAASTALVWVAWDWFAPRPIGPPLKVGAPAPPLVLNDPETGESATIWNRPRHVLWVAFWSPDGPHSGAELEAIRRVWRRLEGRPPFAMVVVVSPGSKTDWRSVVGDQAEGPPVLLAGDGSLRAFGVRSPPMHFLIDDRGLVVAVAGVADRPTSLERLAEQAEGLLDAIAPVDRRLAWAPAQSLSTRKSADR